MRALSVLAAVVALCSFASPAGATEPDGARGPVMVVDPIDVLPDIVVKGNLEAGRAALAEYIGDLRKDPGLVSVTLLSQDPTDNHFQLVERWKDLATFQRHRMSADAIKFRAEAQKLLGGPYDHRVYEVR